ncbi:MAG: GxxExxY protein [Gemmatimonadales bacterium]|nr:GxxExxY protein [Gemmatimonadales bacterium]
MNADERRFKHEKLTERIIKAFFDVEKEFGLEARFRGRVVGVFKADLLVNGCVIVELKAVKELGRTHEAQTLNYLRAGVLEVALLLNFGPQPQIRRLAFSNDRKGHGAREQLQTRTGDSCR